MLAWFSINASNRRKRPTWICSKPTKPAFYALNSKQPPATVDSFSLQFKVLHLHSNSTNMTRTQKPAVWEGYAISHEKFSPLKIIFYKFKKPVISMNNILPSAREFSQYWENIAALHTKDVLLLMFDISFLPALCERSLQFSQKALERLSHDCRSRLSHRRLQGWKF